MSNIEHFVAPAFTPPPQTIVFVWWSWHPRYPKWSKSCWKASTIEESLETLDKPLAHELRYYHNKLIREGDGTFVEVYDLPFDPTKLNK